MPRKRNPRSMASMLDDAREATILARLPQEFHDVLAQCAAGKVPAPLSYLDKKMATSRRHQFNRLLPLLIVQNVPGAQEFTQFIMRTEEGVDRSGWIYFIGVPAPEISKIVQVRAQSKEQAEQTTSEDEFAKQMGIETDKDKLHERITREMQEKPISPEDAERIARNAQAAKQRQAEYEEEIRKAKRKKSTASPDATLNVFDKEQSEGPPTKTLEQIIQEKKEPKP